MALTISNDHVEQVGRRFVWTGTVTSGAAAAADVALFDLTGGSIDLNPYNKPSSFTCFKLVRIQSHPIGQGGVNADHQWHIDWDAGTDDVIMYLSPWHGVDADFSDFPQGGIPNTKATNYNGDIRIYVAGTVANGDSIAITIEGELTD